MLVVDPLEMPTTMFQYGPNSYYKMSLIYRKCRWPVSNEEWMHSSQPNMRRLTTKYCSGPKLKHWHLLPQEFFMVVTPQLHVTQAPSRLRHCVLSWLKQAHGQQDRFLIPSLFKLTYTNRKIQKTDLPSPWTIFQFSHASKLFSYAKAVIFSQVFLTWGQNQCNFSHTSSSGGLKELSIRDSHQTPELTLRSVDLHLLIPNYSYRVTLISIYLASKVLSNSHS